MKYLGRLGDGLIYQRGPCRVLLSGPQERGRIGWHFSISCADRNPTWEEQRDARYELIPDAVYMVSILPPKSEYVNVNPFTLSYDTGGSDQYFSPPGAWFAVPGGGFYSLTVSSDKFSIRADLIY